MGKTISHRQLSKKGGNTTKERHGVELFSEMGKKGSATKLQKYGKEYFSRIGKISAEKRRLSKLKETQSSV